MTARQSSPGCGGESPYQPSGSLMTSVNYRAAYSDTHYRGTDEQEQRHDLNTYVINRQEVLEVRLNYAIDDELSVGLSVPYFWGSWSIPRPTSPRGQRFEQNAEGLGDIIVGGRYWLWETKEAPTFNVQVGLGLKIPTGKEDVQDQFPDNQGRNVQRRPVDVSIQPGDGGWGALFEVNSFLKFADVFTLFFSGAYLINPRDTNSNESSSGTNYSVPDQYLLNLGIAWATPLEGVALSVAVRWEAVPNRDLIGDEHGFRRPGYTGYVAPGLTLPLKGFIFDVSVPIRWYANRIRNAEGNAGDATFPDYIVLASVSTKW